MKKRKSFSAVSSYPSGTNGNSKEKETMAKVSATERDNKRRKLVKKHASKREKLKAIINNRSLPPEERFQAMLKLAEMPRNSSKTRVRNRCALTGRPRGYHRKFNLSRIKLRDLASRGELPGVTKSSW